MPTTTLHVVVKPLEHLGEGLCDRLAGLVGPPRLAGAEERHRVVMASLGDLGQQAVQVGGGGLVDSVAKLVNKNSQAVMGQEFVTASVNKAHDQFRVLYEKREELALPTGRLQPGRGGGRRAGHGVG